MNRHGAGVKHSEDIERDSYTVLSSAPRLARLRPIALRLSHPRAILNAHPRNRTARPTLSQRQHSADTALETPPHPPRASAPSARARPRLLAPMRSRCVPSSLSSLCRQTEHPIELGPPSPR